jgi:WD40 repeat protein
MDRHAKIMLLALFCASCGSKPAPDLSAKRPAQVSQAAYPSANTNTQTTAASAQPQAKIEARAVLVPAPAEKPKEPIPHEAVVTIPNARRILFAAASPSSEEIFVLAQMSNNTYGGSFFVVRLDDAGKKVEAVMEGTNAGYADAPVWSPDGATAYFVFDNGNFRSPGGEYGHGLFAWDRSTGKVTQILKDSIDGLALSPDGKLAASWNYTTGDKLTVYNLQTKQVVRAWAGQVHSEDDLVLSDLAFTPDGKSLLARLYEPGDPVMQFDIASGKISPFAKDVQSFVTIGDSVYLLQFVPVPFSNPENPHRLTRWTTGNTEPVTLVEDFLYEQLTGSNGNPLLVARRAQNYNAGLAIYDTKTRQVQTAGESCGTAIVTTSGKVLYTFGGELIADPAVCSGNPPRQN